MTMVADSRASTSSHATAGLKRSRSSSSSSSTSSSGPGPAPPGPSAPQDGVKEDDDEDDDVGPMPPPPPTAEASSSSSAKKSRLGSEERAKPKRLPHEELYLSALPCASRYSQSFMHRAVVNFVTVTPSTQFVITASIDGHIKFWKKQEVGIEFVKHYRAHLGVVTAVSVSADGGMFASAGSDRTLKVFDVFNFDLINMIKVDYVPRAICWIHRKGRAEVILAAVAEGSNVIRLYDGRGDGTPFAEIDSIHRHPVHLIRYNEVYNCVVSADESGMMEFWSPNEPYEKPSSEATGMWELKTRTDLFDFKKKKTVPTSLEFSPKYDRFVTHSVPDRAVRVFDFKTGKLLRKIDESLTTMQEMQVAGTLPIQLDDMEMGRRLALEKQLDRESEEAVTSAVASAQGLRTTNAVFDETGQFIIYPAMLGIKGELRHSELRIAANLY